LGPLGDPTLPWVCTDFAPSEDDFVPSELPDGKPIGIIIDHTTAQGLQGRFTENMVQYNKEAATGAK
jgi:hypothetical protein